jgi:chlorite dismutase
MTTTQPAPASHPYATGPAHGKQFVKFSFFQVRDDVRRAPESERAELGAALAKLLDGSSQRMLTRTYSTVGTRADTDFLVWQVSDELTEIQEWHGALLRSPLGGALERPHSYLSMTMRSMYTNPLHQETMGRETLREDGGTADYLFVYPMVKSRPWYELSLDERQAMMSEHIAIGHKYHGVKINTTYSYGLDDQEFVVAFEGDSPGEFLALVRELRTSRASAYTERDTPMFTCRRLDTSDLLAAIGLGPAL